MTTPPPETADILIRGCDVVTLDDAGTVLRDAAIAVSGGRIAWIGSAAAEGLPRAETVLDGRGRLAMPGLIDAHVHTAQQLLRGKLAEISRSRALRMPPWKNYYIPFEGLLEPEDVHLSGLVAYTNMLLCGTTCFADAGGPHPDEMARAALEVGIRGFVALSTVDRNTDFAGPAMPPSMLMSTDGALERNVALVRRWRREGQGRVQGTLALRQIIVCTPELTRQISAAAHELDAKIHTHLAEGTYEVDYALERFNCRPTEYLEQLGVLSRHLHGAHSVILTPEEVDLYQKHRVSACHCAMNNYGIGMPRLHEMWRRGIDIGLGTDGAATAGTLDIFQVAHAARIGQAAMIGHPYHIRTPMSAEALLQVATRGGARALGLGAEIGSLEVGKRADILLADTTGADQMGAEDPLFLAAHCVVGQDIRSVIVDGRLVVREREVLTIDMDALRHRLAKRRPEIMARFDAVVA
ncbi:amidohydrolase [Roseomonas sp. GC11]|uniref:amidohydrolase family protein n=1 Tax=Roseomonas sp. GC11 TaxID=2950546 RepID=UPI00210CA485|nr:amidohydrolase [Roseomonas sp. GC11]MCQ4158697.1 amidohydrolase [Roseomonas sp. GC11]